MGRLSVFMWDGKMRLTTRILTFAAMGLGFSSGSFVHFAPTYGMPGPPLSPGEPLEPLFERARIEWPPDRVLLLAFKEEKVLELWAASAAEPLRYVKTFGITAASGIGGPKRREGDLQVPEGFYRLTDLNPFSRFHLSIRIDYPNRTDIARSRVARSDMGGDIFLHGDAVSIGCIAVGDEAIERLYGLLESVPSGKRSIWIAPVDFRKRPGFRIEGEEPWVEDLYQDLETKILAIERKSKSRSSPGDGQ